MESQHTDNPQKYIDSLYMKKESTQEESDQDISAIQNSSLPKETTFV